MQHAQKLAKMDAEMYKTFESHRMPFRRGPEELAYAHRAEKPRKDSRAWAFEFGNPARCIRVSIGGCERLRRMVRARWGQVMTVSDGTTIAC